MRNDRPLQKLVVGVSDTASETAVEWVVDRLRTRPAEVTLVSAFDWDVTDWNEVDRALERVGRTIRAASPESIVHLGSVDAPAADAIAEATREAELLVIGSRRREHLASLTGATALRLAGQSRCATVIVPEAWSPAPKGLILVGVDDDSSDGAVELAAREAEATGARLELVRAWTAPLPAFDPLVWIADTEHALRVDNQEQLDAVVERAKAAHPTVHIAGLVREGLPSAALAARAGDADLVVLGTHRHGVVIGFLLGSTAQELLRNSTTPVCVVPEPAAG